MEINDTPTTPDNGYTPNLEVQDEEALAGGSNRLNYILVGIILALGIGYFALPKGSGSGIASVTPSFMLSDAAVTATVPAAEAPVTENPAAATTAAGITPATTAVKTTAAAKTVATTTKPVAITAAAPVAPVAAPEPVAAPVAAPAPAPAVAVPAAPTTITLAGKIEDENGRPLAGATVFLKGTNKISSSDANGNYTIEVAATGENVLTYGYGGYEDETVSVRGGKAVNVSLTPSAKATRKRR